MKHDEFRTTSTRRIYVSSGLTVLVILGAGWVLARTGDALSEQTGLGASFIGVALVAASTSLPEVSTSLGAVRRGNHQMAVSNILGTNCLEVALFFLADAVYRGGPILAALDRSAPFAAALGMVVTASSSWDSSSGATVRCSAWASIRLPCSFCMPSGR
jgi:cation:H+ antiporter